MRAKAFKARLDERGERLGLVVVDYLGLLDPTGDDARRRLEKHEALGEYARRLKGLARTVNAPVLALAQLNRDAEKAGVKATRGMIGDSYAILRHADTVLLFSRPLPGADASGAPALSIQKAREGRTQFFDMAWDSARETYQMGKK
jgi:replicative DNA helicase